MSRKLSFFFIIPVLFSFIACKDTYFRSIRYDRDGLAGEQPFDPKKESQEYYYRFEYSLLGKPKSVEYLRNGVPYGDKGWAIAEIKKTDRGVEIDFAPAKGRKYISYTDVAKAVMKEAAGGTTELTFFNPFGKITDNSGEVVYRRLFTWTSRGLIAKLSFFDRTGNPVLGFRTGYHAELMQYDEQGRVISRTFAGLDEKPAKLYYRPYSVEHIRYAEGSIESHTYEDSENKSAADDQGCFRTDEKILNGLLTEKRCFNEKGEPAGLKSRPSVYGQTYQYEKGRIVELREINSEGKAEKTTPGPVHRFAYDDKGFLKEESYFAADGTTAGEVAGVHRIVFNHDGAYNNLLMQCFGKKAEAVLCSAPLNFHRREQSFDQAGRITEVKYSGTDGKPAVAGPDRAARRLNHYDKDGRPVETLLFGPDDKPIAGAEGFHRVQAQFDAQGAVTEVAYFATDGKPTLLAQEGYHRAVFKPGSLGNTEEVEFFGTDGKPTARVKLVCAKTKMKFNEFGDVTQFDMFDGDNKPCFLESTSIHSIRTEWNGRGMKTAEQVFDENGKPTTVPHSRIHKIVYDYYPDGRKKEEKKLAMDGSATDDGLMVHREEWFYYPDGRLKEIKRYGADGHYRNSFNY